MENRKFIPYSKEEIKEMNQLEARKRSLETNLKHVKESKGIHKNFMTFPLVMSAIGALLVDVSHYAMYNAVNGYIANFVIILPIAIGAEFAIQKMIYKNPNKRIKNLEKQIANLGKDNKKDEKENKKENEKEKEVTQAKKEEVKYEDVQLNDLIDVCAQYGVNLGPTNQNEGPRRTLKR